MQIVIILILFFIYFINIWTLFLSLYFYAFGHIWNINNFHCIKQYKHILFPLYSHKSLLTNFIFFLWCLAGSSLRKCYVSLVLIVLLNLDKSSNFTQISHLWKPNISHIFHVNFQLKMLKCHRYFCIKKCHIFPPFSCLKKGRNVNSFLEFPSCKNIWKMSRFPTVFSGGKSWWMLQISQDFLSLFLVGRHQQCSLYLTWQTYAFLIISWRRNFVGCKSFAYLKS